jgi:hypothetical protein
MRRSFSAIPIAVLLLASLVSLVPSMSGAQTAGPLPSTLGQRPSGGFLKADRLAKAEAELGVPIQWYVAMAGKKSVNDMRGSVHGQLKAKGAVLPTVSDRMNLVMTVPLAFGKAKGKTAAGQAEIRGLLRETASGRWDDAYRQVAQTLIDGGYPDAVIRLGHEFTGGWYPWSAQGNAPAYIAAYQHVHNVMASVSPQFRFEWNAARNTWLRYGPDAYPGDAYVDIVGLDVYYEPWKGDGEFTEDYWQRRYLRVLNHHFEFARARGKQVSYAEWGNGGVDEPDFIRKMHSWFASLPTQGSGSLLYHAYFNVNKTLYNLDVYPQSKAVYLELFGSRSGATPPPPTTPPSTSPAPAPTPTTVAPDPGDPSPTPPPAPAPPDEPVPPVLVVDPLPTLTVPERVDAVQGEPVVIDIETNATRVQWAKVTGPGAISWSDKQEVDAEARFHSPGVYLVAVRAHTGAGVTRERVKVFVSDS